MIAPVLALLALAGTDLTAPCLRPARAGTQVQGDVRICPGRYRVPDPSERGVIIVAASGTRIDLSGVVLESGDSLPTRFAGIGITSRNVDGVSIVGGTVRGYRIGVRLEGGRGHRITGVNLSGSRRLPIRSTEAQPDTADRLDPARSEVFQSYGAGLVLARTVGAIVSGVIARARRTASACWRRGRATWPTTTWEATAAGRFSSGAPPAT
jgi:hypothetical protein